MTTLGRLVEMTETDKFSAYVRFSMHAALVAFAILSFRPALEEPVSLESGTAIFIALANGVLAAFVIERSPVLSDVTKTPKGLNAAALTINLACWLVTVLVFATNRSVQSSGLSLFLLSSFAFALTIHLPHSYLITLALSAVTAALVEHPTFAHPVFVVVFCLLLVWGSKTTVWSAKVVKELCRTRNLESQLRVHEERLRFAQELHDSLGQHLAAMSLKLQLAIALYERDRDKVKGEMRELEHLVRLMREDLRQVVTGYRNLSPSAELKTAIQLLEEARVSVLVAGNSQAIPEKSRQVAAWFIREATTNVIKHSTASTVSFAFSTDGVTIVNDGADQDVGALGGMQVLQDRAQKIGGAITLTHDADIFTASLTWKDNIK
ncbi:sensor histidine kinase [Corynebacterium hindlerae]|nr:histidine kinase [Corynebacterium hindlerae]